VHRFRSRYYQFLKKKNVSRGSFGLPPTFKSFEEWVRQHANLSNFRALQTLEIYSDVFGRDNVGVFLFEKLVQDPECYFREVCRFIGVDDDMGWQVSCGQRENEGWTEGQVERLQRICLSRWQSRLFRRLPADKRAHWLGLDKPDGTPKLKVAIPDAVARLIEDQNRDDHRVIQERWSVPLEVYGYAV
jgi:hypothetical protein